MTNPTTNATDTTAPPIWSVTVNGPGISQSTTGGAKTTGAWLRALADEIDPRGPHMRDAR